MGGEINTVTAFRDPSHSSLFGVGLDFCPAVVERMMQCKVCGELVASQDQKEHATRCGPVLEAQRVKRAANAVAAVEMGAIAREAAANTQS